MICDNENILMWIVFIFHISFGEIFQVLQF